MVWLSAQMEIRLLQSMFRAALSRIVVHTQPETESLTAYSIWAEATYKLKMLRWTAYMVQLLKSLVLLQQLQIVRLVLIVTTQLHIWPQLLQLITLAMPQLTAAHIPPLSVTLHIFLVLAVLLQSMAVHFLEELRR